MFFLWVKPSLRTGKCKKLSPFYCGPYLVLKQINEQAYRLQLPDHIKVHNVFHVSLLKKNVSDPNHILNDSHLSIGEDATFEVFPEQILQTRSKPLRNRTLTEHLIKWSTYIEDATWEREDILVQNFPQFISRWGHLDFSSVGGCEIPKNQVP